LHRRSEALPIAETEPFQVGLAFWPWSAKNPMGSTRSEHFFSRQNSMAAWREFGVANAQAATGRRGHVDAVRDKKRSMETDFHHCPWLAIAFD